MSCCTFNTARCLNISKSWLRSLSIAHATKIIEFLSSGRFTAYPEQFAKKCGSVRDRRQPYPDFCAKPISSPRRIVVWVCELACFR